MTSRGSIIKAVSVILTVTLLLQLFTIAVSSVSFYTVKINYYFIDGTPAHDPYIATYNVGEALNYDVTNPAVSGFEPMALTDPANDPAALPTGGVSEATTHIETASLQSDMTYSIYYVAGLTHYAARYYLQNIYDDLYTLDRDRTNANQNRLGKTGTAPADLEAEEITGFTSLFHEPDAIAADGSTVFRVYYDRNYYTVNFDLGEGGYGVDPVYAKYQTVYRIDEPKRLGYTFTGWARTDKDSSINTYDPTGEDEDGWHYIDASGNVISKAQAEATPVSLSGDQTVPAENTYYQALWSNGTSSFSVVYWIEKPDGRGITAAELNAAGSKDAARTIISENYSVLAAKDVKNVPSGTMVNLNTTIRNAADTADVQLWDLFGFDLSAQGTVTDDDGNIIGVAEDSDGNPLDKDGNRIDFAAISETMSAEMVGKEDFYVFNPDISQLQFGGAYEEDDLKTHIAVAGDGTTRINVYYDRKDFTLKFYYARQGYTNGALDPNKISLTNSTKKFSNEANDAQYLNTTSKNPLEAIAEGTWERNIAASLPQIKDEYKQYVTEGYEDFTDNSRGRYRYYYYQVQAQYNEPLKNKWLIDAITSVPKNGYPGQICEPGSWAVEYYTYYRSNHVSVNNFTVKGIYERLGDELMFETKYRNSDVNYNELHYLLSWTNTSTSSDNWNYGNDRILHFTYENYVELLPRECSLMEDDNDGDGSPDGPQALIDQGIYENIFYKKNANAYELVDPTTSFVYNANTTYYGLKTENRIETTDSGSQYPINNHSDATICVYSDQVPTDLIGFTLENYRKYTGKETDLPQALKRRLKSGQVISYTDNTVVDWSDDTNAYRHATIKYFYKRNIYSLKWRNGNRLEEEHTRDVMYGAPFNSVVTRDAGNFHAGDYRYWFEEPSYFVEDLRDYYTFEGWYYTPYYYRQVDKVTATMPADDVTLYAKWTPKTVDVIFYDDYDDFYVDRKGEHPERRVVLGKDADDNDVTDVRVDYGSYVPLMSIPVNDDNPDNPRPRLTPIAEGASFAGWYYIRDRIPVRYEPENVPVIAFNEESVGDNAKLRLFAEWVTKDVAKYKVSYVKDSDDTEIAAPTIGRAYVWKTKTFNAKSGDELYDEYKWTQEGEQEGLNWWPTTNSSSIVIKANNSDDEYEPNKLTFRYIQKDKVYYKVQYLDASSRTPLHEEVVRESTHASVSEDARIIPGYIARTATQSIVLTASSDSDPATQQAEELENNVITFLYDQNQNEYMYEVEYLTQDLGANTYSLYSSETLTVQKTGDGAVDLSVADLYNREIPRHIENSGFARVTGGTNYNVTDASGDRDTTLIPVADNGTVAITGTDKKTIMIYYSRNSYSYQYQYVDQSAEKAYLNYLDDHKDDPDPTAGAPWNGLLATFTDPSFTGQVQQVITINPARDYTYTDPVTSEQTDYTRVTDENGALKDVTLTIQPDNAWNLVKIYYRKDIERELNYQMVCVNNSPDTDYYEDGTPKFGRLNFTIQTVLDYNGIKDNTFYDTNNEVIDDSDPQHPDYLHLHRYTFLGWYTTPTYDEAHPETNLITTNATLTKEDLPTGTDLPDNRTKYYALVKQDTVTMDVMFYYTDDYTVSSFRAASDDDLSGTIQQAVDNADNAQAPDAQKVHPTGERVGKEVTFTAPNGYQNHTEIAWHRNDGYTLSMTDIDNRVYKYQFAEWWEIDESNSNALIRHHNWNSADGWDPDALSQQVARNRNQYLIAVYARNDVSTLPYTINYQFQSRIGATDEERTKTFVKHGTLTADQLNEKSSNCAITADGDYRLTDEFILSESPFESNHGETLLWSNAENRIVKTSEKAHDAVMDGDTVVTPATTNHLTTTITAKQTVKTVYANYRLSPDGNYETPVATFYGANHNLDEGMKVIEAPETYNGMQFSYWAVRKSAKADAPVIAKGLNPLFELCMFDNYWLTPVYEAATDTGNNDDPASGDGSTGGGSAPADPAEPPAEAPSITLEHLDYSRNRWTDEEGNISDTGETDLVFSDFEIAFEDNGNNIYNSADYKTGVVIEYCAQVPEDVDFVQGKDYKAVTDYDNLKTAIDSHLDGEAVDRYVYKGSGSTAKYRSILFCDIPTTDLTNHNRTDFWKYYKNAKKNGAYTNSTYLLKATAYMQDKDGNITLSNSVYFCYKDIASKNDALPENITETVTEP